VIYGIPLPPIRLTDGAEDTVPSGGLPGFITRKQSGEHFAAAHFFDLSGHIPQVSVPTFSQSSGGSTSSSFSAVPSLTERS